jgi:hypothetical protein
MGVGWQTLENTAMKAALGMPKGMTGVYVTKTEPLFHAAKVLQVSRGCVCGRGGGAGGGCEPVGAAGLA